MCEPARPPITLTLDLKKNRIRMHKAMLHMMGDPRYLQVLVNTQDMLVAILGVDNQGFGNFSYNVSPQRSKSDNSYELYGDYFIEKLCGIYDDLKKGYTYHLTGEVYPDKKAAVFSFKTLKRLEEQQVPR